ncbi:hypothetical protein GLAREA_02378 [Glarea lozoyensis ATCC 20868]|uniref:Uncharacterized protein n=1 Tax=Glarea lozoyensis (strain ATCC 20868 / MF5171) TaxID=1116229 RepID=S3CL25_GLAL2|nr:uncharacterized protein GLAREA_02378 [Glarea lozoyensis ATCC 20868]EPE26465.1 hypothetical protein GLAREA_02378 [Glarea lozoyensis ATCC 20868]
MEPYRHEGHFSNPRIEIYSPHSSESQSIPHGAAQGYYADPDLQESNQTLLSQSAHLPPSDNQAYTHISSTNRLLPLSHEEPTFIRKPRNQISHVIRVTWRVLSLILSLTIIGFISHILYLHARSEHEKFKYSSGLELPAWPDDNKLKLYPTYLYLAAAIFAAAINFMALILVKFKIFIKLRPLISIPSTFLASLLWLGAVVYFKSWDNKKDNSAYDIWTWTCSHKNFEVSYGNKVLGFGRICGEMTYVYYAGVSIFSLEILNLFAQVWNLINSKRKSVAPKKQKPSGGIGWSMRIGRALGTMIS